MFKYKFNKEGELQECKARICVRGDLQKVDNLKSTYAATLAAKTFRTVIALAADGDLECKQFDVVGAFMNALREGQVQVLCDLPEGFKVDSICVKLEKALYGLKDSPLL